MRERGKGKEGRARSANVTNEERTAEENEYDDPERNEIANEVSGESRDVNFAVGGDDPPSDLDWGEIENFGTDSEVGQFLQNNEEKQGY